MVYTSTLAHYLRGLAFPCTKRDCINYARQQNAPGEVIAFLEKMRDQRFNSLADVWVAAGEVS